MKVRYYGHVGQVTGYGRAAEGMCMALIAAGCELEIRPLAPYEQIVVNPDLQLARCIRRDWELDPAPDAILVHTLPMDCHRVIELAKLDQLDIPVVAYTTWEGTGTIPDEMAEAFVDFDQVWTPSAVGAALMPLRTCQVQVMPHAYDENAPAQRPELGDRHENAPFTFYYLGAWTCRKNPEGVIRAFAHIFTKEDDVALVIRSMHASEEEFALALHRTGLNQRTSPKIMFGNKAMSDEGVRALHQNADCFVTASRGEGWNLPAFEALLARRHIISPARLGSDEFLVGTSAVRYMGYQQPAGRDARVMKDGGENFEIQVIGAQGQTVKTNWQEPDLLHLAQTMYIAYKGRNRDLTVSYDVAERFGYRSVGARARALLEAL